MTEYLPGSDEQSESIYSPMTEALSLVCLGLTGTTLGIQLFQIVAQILISDLTFIDISF